MKFAWIRWYAIFLMLIILLYYGLMNFIATNGMFDLVEIAELDLKEKQ